jgi:hypothetical protein
MAGLQDLLSWMDSKRRLVGHNLSDLIQNPAGVAEQLDDQAKNYNQTVTPVASAGSLYNRPMTEAEKDQRSIDLALNFGPMGVGTIKGVVGPQHEALRLAQQRASLPVEQNGLGLPANNTPQMRADAMFPQDGYHLSRHGVDVKNLDSGVFAIAPFDAVGTHVGTKEAADARWQALSGRHPDDVRGVSYPIKFADQTPMLNDVGRPFDEQRLSDLLRSKHDYDNGEYRALNAKTRKELFDKFTNIPYINDVEAAGSISNIVHPDNIRSRFAAFDPWRRNAAIATMMGVVAPDLLADDNEQKRKK